MKKKILIILPIIIICAILIFLIINTNKKESLNSNKSKVVEDVINNVFYNDSTTLKDIETTLKTSVPRDRVFIGKDSFIRSKPDKDLIKKYKLEKYEKEQDKFIKNVEKKFKDNASYNIIDSSDKNVTMEIKPWYYYHYTQDLAKVGGKLLDMANYKFSEEDLSKEEFVIKEYKARVISIKAMDSFLDNYDNKENEVRKVSIDYKENTPGEFDYFTLYMVLGGRTAEKGPSDDEQESRVNTYIDNAIKNGIINKNKPLDL